MICIQMGPNLRRCFGRDKGITMLCFCGCLALEAPLNDHIHLTVHLGKPCMCSEKSFHRRLSRMAFMCDVKNLGSEWGGSWLVRRIWNYNSVSLVYEVSNYCQFLPHFPIWIILGCFRVSLFQSFLCLLVCIVSFCCHLHLFDSHIVG